MIRRKLITVGVAAVGVLALVGVAAVVAVGPAIQDVRDALAGEPPRDRTPSAASRSLTDPGTLRDALFDVRRAAAPNAPVLEARIVPRAWLVVTVVRHNRLARVLRWRVREQRLERGTASIAQGGDPYRASFPLDVLDRRAPSRIERAARRVHPRGVISAMTLARDETGRLRWQITVDEGGASRVLLASADGRGVTRAR